MLICNHYAFLILIFVVIFKISSYNSTKMMTWLLESRYLDPSKKSRKTSPEAFMSTSVSCPLCWQRHSSVHVLLTWQAPTTKWPHTRSNHKRDAIYILHFVLLSRAETNTRLSLSLTTVLASVTLGFFLPPLPLPPSSNKLIISERLQPNVK